jgi:hypothetical protein
MKPGGHLMQMLRVFNGILFLHCLVQLVSAPNWSLCQLAYLFKEKVVGLGYWHSDLFSSVELYHPF